MTFSIMNSELSGRLSMVSRVVNSKNVLPILNDIVFTVKDGTLSLKASDSENTITTDVPLGTLEGEATFSVNARDITDAVKNIASEQEMTFEYDESANIVKVNYFSGLFSLPATSALEFPVTPSLNEESKVSFQMTDQKLADNIGRTLFATAQDELRPVMNGIFFDLKEDGLIIVASDGHQLIRCHLSDIKAESQEQAGSFILPKKPAGLLKNILDKSGEAVEIASDGRNLTVTAGPFSLTSRLIEGRYPNYNSVIPKNNTNILTVNRLDMLAALKRISPFSSGASNLIRMHVSENEVQFDAENWEFNKTATEKMVCDYNGNKMSIGFKGCSVMELLTNITSQEVVAQLADPARAALFLPSEQPEGEEILMLQMPMLIND